jgi:hypothetical protein
VSTGVELDKVGMLGKTFHPSKKNKKSVDKLLQICYYNNVRSGDAISEP